MSTINQRAALFGWQSREPWQDQQSGILHELYTGFYLLFYEDGRVEGLESALPVAHISAFAACTMQGTYTLEGDDINICWSRKSMPTERSNTQCAHPYYPTTIPAYFVAGEHRLYFKGSAVELASIQLGLLDGTPEFLID